MQKTEHYGLNLWDLSDRIQMEDFNGDNRKLDAALAALAAGGGGAEQIGRGYGNYGPAQATSFYIWGRDNPTEWEKWSIILIMGNVTQPDSGVTPYAMLRKKDDTFDPSLKFQFSPGGFLYILLPLKDGTRDADGFFISGGKAASISSDTPYNDLFKFEMGGETASGGGGLVLIREVRVIGVR